MEISWWQHDSVIVLFLEHKISPQSEDVSDSASSGKATPQSEDATDSATNGKQRVSKGELAAVVGPWSYSGAPELQTETVQLSTLDKVSAKLPLNVYLHSKSCVKSRKSALFHTNTGFSLEEWLKIPH